LNTVDDQLDIENWENGSDHKETPLLDLRESPYGLKDPSQIYSGKVRIDVDVTETEVISLLPRQHEVPVDSLRKSIGDKKLFPNQCCLLCFVNGKHLLAIYKPHKGIFINVPKPTHSQDEGMVRPVTYEQAFVFKLINDPDIEFITLTGQAGTGKTLISLLSLYEMLDNSIKRIIVFRPTVQQGSDMGFLPGNADKKFSPYKDAIFDAFGHIYERNIKDGKTSKRTCEKKLDDKAEQQYKTTQKYLEDCQMMEKIMMFPINHLTGRSIPDAGILIDEGQYFSQKVMQMILSRAAKNTKVIICGDITQTTADRNIHWWNSGLSIAIENFHRDETAKGRYAHITLTRCLRSWLSAAAARNL
jgi:predicted ribonuclease YlaK